MISMETTHQKEVRIAVDVTAEAYQKIKAEAVRRGCLHVSTFARQLVFSATPGLTGGPE
jgi:hypothetical protein